MSYEQLDDLIESADLILGLSIELKEMIEKMELAAEDTIRIDALERARLAGAYVDVDNRGASIRLDRSLHTTIRDAIDDWIEISPE